MPVYVGTYILYTSPVCLYRVIHKYRHTGNEETVLTFLAAAAAAAAAAVVAASLVLLSLLFVVVVDN